MNSISADNIEKTWDTIAESFEKTRRHPWKPVVEYINLLPSNSIIGDFGSGNGRHSLYAAEKGLDVIALDISCNLLKILNNKLINVDFLNNIHLIHGSMINIPLKNDCIDSGIAIASLHNIPFKKNRTSALKEIYRVIKPNGNGLISVWSKNQEIYSKSLQNKNQLITVNLDFQSGDTIIYWNQDKLHIPRYYHFYEKEEFINELIQAGFEIIKILDISIASKTSTENYFAYIKKPS